MRSDASPSFFRRLLMWTSDRPFEHDGVLADRRVHQLVARERPPRLPDQHFQEPELGRRQRHLLALVERPVAV